MRCDFPGLSQHQYSPRLAASKFVGSKVQLISSVAPSPRLLFGDTHGPNMIVGDVDYTRIHNTLGCILLNRLVCPVYVLAGMKARCRDPCRGR